MLNQNEERLQKVLARAGIASRRACEELIEAGRVRVNGKVVSQLGAKVDPTKDKVSVDDQPVPIRPSLTPSKIYLLLYKPEGYLSTVSDPQGRQTIMDLVETDQRLYPVGRLDMDTEGLLLLTNDGTFANTVMHPRYGLEKEYLALLDGIPASHELEQLRKGVPIPVDNDKTGEREYYTTQPAKVEIVRNEGSNTLVRFVIKEGKKRQIRLMAQYVHHPVLELKRVGYGPVRLGDLAPGRYRPLSKAEVKGLLDAATTDSNDSKKTYSRTGKPGLPPRPSGNTAPAANRSFKRGPAQSNEAPEYSGGNRNSAKPPSRNSSPPFVGDRNRKGRTSEGQNSSYAEDSNSNFRRPARSGPAGNDSGYGNKPKQFSRNRPAPANGSYAPAGSPAPANKRGNYKPGRTAPVGNRGKPKGR